MPKWPSRHWHAHAPSLRLCVPRLRAASEHQDEVVLLHGQMLQRWCLWPTCMFLPPRSLQVLDSIYFSRRFHVRCVAKAVDKAGHVGTPLRSNIVTIGTDSAICHTPVVAGTARGFQAQSFIATLKYLDVKHKEHPNRYEPGEGESAVPSPGPLGLQSSLGSRGERVSETTSRRAVCPLEQRRVLRVALPLSSSQPALLMGCPSHEELGVGGAA